MQKIITLILINELPTGVIILCSKVNIFNFKNNVSIIMQITTWSLIMNYCTIKNFPLVYGVDND